MSTVLIIGTVGVTCWKFIMIDRNLGLIGSCSASEHLSEKEDQMTKMRYWIAGSNLLMILFVLASNASLLFYLNKKERIMAEKLGNITVFKSEKIKLILIALVFVISYAIDIASAFVFYSDSIEYRDVVYKEIYYI